MDTHVPSPRIVSQADWLVARKALLEQEKEAVHQLDQLRAERLKLPWVKIDKTYSFETPDGQRTLSDLFEGRSQLLVQHFMFAPDWEEGCVGCSLGADHMHGIWPHLEHHDVKFNAVSRAPLAKIGAFKKRMGWDFDWASSGDGDFNYDFGVSFREGAPAPYNYADQTGFMSDLPGLSAFYKDADGAIYHTYSCYARGTELASGVFGLLDIMPKGRNETGPNFDMTDWLRHHDKYDAKLEASACGCNG